MTNTAQLDPKTASAIEAVLADTPVKSGLPNVTYTSDDFIAVEQERVFARNWAGIGFGKDVPNVGDAFPVRLNGQPLLIVRDTKKEVRVFHNVCSHRGAILVEEPRNCKRIIKCPYHAWCYDLAGKLRHTPCVGGPDTDTHEDVDMANYGLKEVRSHVFMDVVFVNLSGDAEAFEDQHRKLMNRWSEFVSVPLYHGGENSTNEFTLDTNWKLAVENFCEAYHLPWVHPALNTYSRLEDHENIVEYGAFSGQRSNVYQPQLSRDGSHFPEIPGLTEQWKTGAEYIALFPNVLLMVHKDHYGAVLIQPDGPTKTHERMELYYYQEDCAGSDYEMLRRSNQATWRTVFAEDVDIVESMQRGRSSGGFKGGVLTPVMDTPTHCFHAWMATALLNDGEPAKASMAAE